MLNFSQIPPTQLVDRTTTTYSGGRRRPLPFSKNSKLSNTTNAVGGSFTLNLQPGREGAALSLEAKPEQSTNCVGGILGGVDFKVALTPAL
jgi:hypothetical protein